MIFIWSFLSPLSFCYLTIFYYCIYLFIYLVVYLFRLLFQVFFMSLSLFSFSHLLDYWFVWYFWLLCWSLSKYLGNACWEKYLHALVSTTELILWGIISIGSFLSFLFFLQFNWRIFRLRFYFFFFILWRLCNRCTLSNSNSNVKFSILGPMEVGE
jgi:hypothetical protein